MTIRQRAATGTLVMAVTVGALGTIACGASDDRGAGPGNTGGVAQPGVGGMAVNPGNGGAQTGVGGAQTGNGGVPTGNGGAQTGNGGTQTGNGGAQTGNGGAQTGNGGVPIGSGGVPVGTGGVPVGTGGIPVDPPTDGCNIDSGFPGDEICIAPPPPDKGFQIHYGPSNYDDPAEIAKYTLNPGQETNIYVNAVTGNTQDVYYYKRQYRMRHGSHHLIISESGGGQGGLLGTGRRLGGSQNAIKDNPTGPTPPENEGIGMPLKARTAVSLNLHHFNNTDQPILKEAWINFWYVDKASVKKEAKEMFLLAAGQTIPPNAHVTVTGQRNVTSSGRILTTYGHRHSNNVRFTAFRTRGAQKTLIYEDYDWEEPAVLEYNTLTTNPAPNATNHTEGGYSGILDVMAGDRISWECEIQNKSGQTIIFNQNEAITSEMCILIGDTVDTTISPF